MAGTIHGKSTMILRFAVGTSENDGQRYEVSTSNFHEPIFRSEKTGKYWTIKWEELIAMAIEAGIDSDEEATHAA